MSNYIKKVETKVQPKAEFGWIVNPVINVDKLPRVLKEDINVNEIFQKLTTEDEPKARGELIQQSFQAILSSSYIGKRTSDPQTKLKLIKEMAQLSERNAKAIQNGTLFMSILHAKGFSLMFLEETIKLADGKQKRMDAMFYNQELDILYVIDWKTGYSCDSSALDTLSLYANRMKELNPKTKVGMFLVYVDYGVILPGWLGPKVKSKGVKELEPNFLKFIYYDFYEDYEMDYALFSEKNIAEDLIIHNIPDQFELARKPLCLQDLSDREIRPFGTIGDYDKKTTRSGKEYKGPEPQEEEKLEQIQPESKDSPTPQYYTEKIASSQVEEPLIEKATVNVSPKKKTSPKKMKSQEEEEQNLKASLDSDTDSNESPISSPSKSPTKTRAKKEKAEESPFWNYVCEEESLFKSATKYNVPIEELNTFFIDKVLSKPKTGQSFWTLYKEKIDTNLLVDGFAFKQEDPRILKSILEKYKIDGIKSSFPKLRAKVKDTEKEEVWYSLFLECIKGNSTQIKWFFEVSQKSNKTLASFYSKIFYIGIKNPSCLTSIPDECFTPL